jgi:hypothetical protein
MKRRFLILSVCFGMAINWFCTSSSSKRINGDRNCVLTAYNIRVAIPDTFDRIDIQAVLQMEITPESAPDTIPFILCEHFIGVEAVDILVLDGKERMLHNIIKGDTLLVILPEKDRDRSSIRFDYSLKITTEYATDPYSPFAFEVSDSLCLINAAITRTDNWYPKLEGRMNDRLPPFRLIIDVPARLEVMASGVLTKVNQEGDRRIYEWMNFPEITDRSLYFFAAQREKKVFSYADGFQVHFYVPESAREENIRKIADITHQAFRYFEKCFGEVPGQTFKIMSFPYGYAGLYRSLGVPVSLLTSELKLTDIGYPLRTVIHEVSHTWWGNVVSADAEKDYWLFEGFAKYSEVKGIRSSLGMDIEQLSFSRLKLATLPYVDYLPAVRNAGKEENRFLEMTAAYHYGAMILKMMESIMGEERFSTAVSDYVRICRMTCTDTDNFIGVLNRHLPDSLQSLISGYLDKPGYAEYTIQRVDLDQKDGYWPHLFVISNICEKDFFTKIHLQSDICDSVQNVFIPAGQSAKIAVRSRKSSGPVVLEVDPDGIFPVRQHGLRSVGGMVYRDGRGRILFINVIPHAPLSDAEIQDNMILHSVDGMNLSGKTIESLNDLLVRQAGTRLRLMVQKKDEEPYEVTVVYPG